LKAVVLRRAEGGGGNRAEVVDLPEPSPGPGELVVEMKACGLCGTDIEKLRGEYTASMPVLGHEAVGVVSAVGDGVPQWKEGDRVFPHHHVSCGTCYFCSHGSATMCDWYRKTNLDPGGFSERFRVPQRNVAAGGVLRLPPHLGYELAALVEPLACCVRALERCRVEEEEAVLVAGAGPVGMMHALLLRSMKAAVLVSDVSQPRLDFARRAKVGRVVDAAREDVGAAARDETGGRGADLAIVASGSEKAIAQALGAVRKGGRVCLFGVPAKGSRLAGDIGDVYNAEQFVITSYGATEAETSKAVSLLAQGGSDFGSLVTHRVRLGDFDRGGGAVADGSAMKVVVVP
jgi:L-iditol 2-dehydrogenase